MGWKEDLRKKLGLTASMYSGSEAEASHLLFRMKMLGLDSLPLTLWKKPFSYNSETEKKN